MAAMQYEDPWLPRGKVKPCTGRHGPWITYRSLKIRMCHNCDYTEPMYSRAHALYSDPSVPLADEAEVRAARKQARVAALEHEIDRLLKEDTP